MMVRRKWICLLVSAVMTLIALGQFSVLQAQEKPTLKVWLYRSFVREQNEYMEEQFRFFEQATGIKIKSTFLPSEEIYRKWMASIEAGTFPDVAEIWVQTVDQFNRMGILMDLSDLYTELNTKSPFGPLLEKMVTMGGKKIVIPLNTAAEAHYWRKDILENLGLSVPGTWQELKATAKKITENTSLYGFGSALGRPATDGEKFIQTVLWSHGGSIVNEKEEFVFKSKATLETVRYIASLVEEEIMPPGVTAWDDGSNNRAYLTRWVAGVQNSASIYAHMVKNDPALLKNTVISLIPEGPAGRFTDVVPHAIGVSKDTKYPEAAKKLIKFIMEPDRYQGWIEHGGGNFQPVYLDLMKHPFWEDPYRKPFAEMSLKHGVYQGWPGPPSAPRGEIFGTYVLSDMMQKVILEGFTPEEAIDRAFEEIKEIYARWK